MSLPEIPKSFEDKLKERIRESIGELVTDEDLSRIVQAGVHEALFKPRVVERKNSSGYYSASQFDTKPPFIVEVVMDLLKQDIRSAVEKWFAENPNSIKEIVDHCFRDGLVQILSTSIDEKFRSAQFGILENLKTAGILPR
jgi:hypothetical protein